MVRCRPSQATFPAKAKNCIFLMMEGGPSHIDTFDPKPMLEKMHLKEFTREGEQKSAMESGKRYYVKSPFQFGKHGESGADMSDNWQHLATVADELCFYRGCQVDSVNHPTAMYQMNCGNRFGGDPAIGAWVTYGLGSENQDLPGFLVLPEISYPQGGAANWSNGYLPAYFQGTPLRPKGSPILDLQPPPDVTSQRQRMNLDLLSKLNQRHAVDQPDQEELAARMASYELAFRMQTQVPDAIDLSGEDAKTLDMYGIGAADTDSFGRKCLLARKMIEKGVRFIQLYNGTWDSHDYIERAHGNLIRGVDQPIAALIADLKRRGLLESTLVVWCGEFGRTPDNGVRGGVAYGRDHNPNAMTIWMAGGGCQRRSHDWRDRRIGDDRGGRGSSRPRLARDVTEATRAGRQQVDLLSRRAIQTIESIWRTSDRQADRVIRGELRVASCEGRGRVARGEGRVLKLPKHTRTTCKRVSPVPASDTLACAF